MGKKLVFYTNTNSPNKKDATGAFIPEAKAFADYHDDAELVPVPCRGKSRDQRAQVVYDALGRFDQIETVAFFCHGHPSHVQHGFGIRGKHTIYNLSKILAAKSVQRVIFYCCSVARPNPKIAPLSLCGELHKCMQTFGYNTTVIGHTTAGHTATNPYIKFFSDGDYEGKFLVEPGKTSDWVKLRRKLRKHPTYRFQFPFDLELDLS